VSDFLVTLAGELIGTSALEHVDDGMGVAYGAFLPEPAYSAVRAEIADAAESRHERREDTVDLPRLQVSTRLGEILATHFVVIDDFVDVDVDPEISVGLLNREQLERILMQRLVVGEPSILP
jgi:hypothetical protein